MYELQAHQGAAILKWTSCCSCDHFRGDNPGPEGESHQCHRNPVWRGLFRSRVVGRGALPTLHQPYLPGILCKPCPPPVTTLLLCLATSILSLTWILPFPSCCFFFPPRITPNVKRSWLSGGRSSSGEYHCQEIKLQICAILSSKMGRWVRLDCGWWSGAKTLTSDSWGKIPPLPPTCCVTLDKLLKLSVLYFFHLFK